MQAVSFEEVLELVLAKDTRYHRDAYQFLREALDYTQKKAGKEYRVPSEARDTATLEEAKAVAPKEEEQKHVSGQELLEGIRDYALKEFGPMVMTVFEEWGIRSCKDFGEMVFLLVDHRILRKTDKDSHADFENGYDFYEAFRKPYLPKAKVELKEPKATQP
jgi:uncharacterized repeat protein (TIGR04138 family)